MDLHTPIHGRLIKRYKRFLADVILDTGEIVTAYCPNTGSLMGVKDPERPVILKDEGESSTRKLRYTWYMVEDQGAWVGVHTHVPNQIVYEALQMKIIPELVLYSRIRREVPYGQSSRIDFLLEEEGHPPCYVEVKNVHCMRQKGLAEFPDSVTQRGAKHLGELVHCVQQGARAVVLYVVQREDTSAFQWARDLDPIYAEAALRAHKEGVETLVYDCRLTPESIRLNKPLTLVLR